MFPPAARAHKKKERKHTFLFLDFSSMVTSPTIDGVRADSSACCGDYPNSLHKARLDISGRLQSMQPRGFQKIRVIEIERDGLCGNGYKQNFEKRVSHLS
jgi:hypothetical protein